MESFSADARQIYGQGGSNRPSTSPCATEDGRPGTASKYVNLSNSVQQIGGFGTHKKPSLFASRISDQDMIDGLQFLPPTTNLNSRQNAV